MLGWIRAKSGANELGGELRLEPRVLPRHTCGAEGHGPLAGNVIVHCHIQPTVRPMELRHEMASMPRIP